MTLTKVTYSMIQGAGVNVLDYGADNTGSNDSSTAIQNAVTAAGVGGTVYLPEGTYKLTTGLTDGSGAIHFEGTGEATIISFSGGISAITLNNRWSSIDKIKFIAADYDSNNTAIQVNHTCKNYAIRDCLIWGKFQNPYLGKGIALLGSETGLISRNTLQYHQYAIYTATSTISPNANLFEANECQMNTWGIYIDDGSNCDNTFIGNTIQGNEKGMYIGTGINYSITLTGNHFENNIGSNPIGLLVNCGGGSIVNSIGNYYADYSDTNTIQPFNVVIGDLSQVFFNSNGDTIKLIANSGSPDYSSFTMRSTKNRDFLYNWRMDRNYPAFANYALLLGVTASPTTGTWQRGSVVTNGVPVVGQPSGWVCTEAGTFTTLSGTGTTNGTDGTITGVSNATSFEKGSIITVSAGFATTGPFVVLNSYGTTVIVNSNSSSAGAATLANSNPTFSVVSTL